MMKSGRRGSLWLAGVLVALLFSPFGVAFAAEEAAPKEDAAAEETAAPKEEGASEEEAAPKKEGASEEEAAPAEAASEEEAAPAETASEEAAAPAEAASEEAAAPAKAASEEAAAPAAEVAVEEAAAPAAEVAVEEAAAPAAEVAVEEEAAPAAEVAEEVAPIEEKKAAPVEEMRITGSRVQRMDLTTVAPVTILTREEIEAAGLASIGDILQHLPSQSNAINTQANNGGSGATRVSLRGLGSSRTLILLNGRRFVPGGSGANSSVDLNAIPAAVVERIEVLKDGASVTYGSDAIGGVINIITKRDFDGVEGSVYYGITADGKADTMDLNVTTGHHTKKGHIVFSAGYHRQLPLWTSDRDFSSTDKAYDWGENDGTWTPNGSSATPEGHIIDWTGAEGNERWNGLPADEDGGRDYNGPDGRWHPFAWEGNSDDGSGDLYNYQPENYLLTPQRRFHLFSTGSYDLSSSVRSFFEASFTNRRSRQKLAPTPLFIISEDISVSADNRYNPFGRDFIDIRRRFKEAGNRVYIQDINTARLVLGLDGDLPLLEEWLWDASFTYGRTAGTSVNEGRFIKSRVARALGPDADCTGDCVALNLFGGQGTITDDMLNYIGYTGIASGHSDQKIWQLNLNGDLFEAPGGTAAMAVGYAFRDESGSYIPDPITAIGDTTGNKEESTEGSFNVHEGYVETLIPLIEGVPGVELMELTAAARAVKYNTFGSNLTWKTGLRWKLSEAVTMRSTYSTAFRAPSVSEMFLGTSDSFPGVSDPCSVVDEAGNARDLTDAQKTNCASEGVAADFEDSRAQLHALIGGNDELEPETAKILTAGVVYAPGALEGFSLTLDYFDVRIDNSITTMGADLLLKSCYSKADPSLCDKIIRNTQTGLIKDINDTLMNIGGSRTTGIDFALRYKLATGVGRFGFGLDGTQLLRYNDRLPDDSVVKGLGVYDLGVHPTLKANGSVRWSKADYLAGLNIRYIGGFEECEDDVCEVDKEPKPAEKRRDVDANITMDLYGSYTFNVCEGLGKTALSVGVNNILDQKPSVIYNGFLGTSDASTYDYMGRYVYLRLTQSL